MADYPWGQSFALLSMTRCDKCCPGQAYCDSIGNAPYFGVFAIAPISHFQVIQVTTGSAIFLSGMAVSLHSKLLEDYWLVAWF